jgi:hypothetical protein
MNPKSWRPDLSRQLAVRADVGADGPFRAYIPSLAEQDSQRPAAVKGAPFSWRGGSEPLTARTAGKPSPREGKASLRQYSSMWPWRVR